MILPIPWRVAIVLRIVRGITVCSVQCLRARPIITRLTTRCAYRQICTFMESKEVKTMLFICKCSMTLQKGEKMIAWAGLPHSIFFFSLHHSAYDSLFLIVISSFVTNHDHFISNNYILLNHSQISRHNWQVVFLSDTSGKRGNPYDPEWGS